MMRRKPAPLQLNAIGSLFNIHATAHPVANYRDAQQGDKELVKYLYLALLNQGVMLSRGAWGHCRPP